MTDRETVGATVDDVSDLRERVAALELAMRHVGPVIPLTGKCPVAGCELDVQHEEPHGTLVDALSWRAQKYEAPVAGGQTVGSGPVESREPRKSALTEPAPAPCPDCGKRLCQCKQPAPAPDGPWSSKTVSGSGLLFCPECNCYHLSGDFCTERLRRGEAAVEAGRTRPMAEVLAELREKYKVPAPDSSATSYHNWTQAAPAPEPSEEAITAYGAGENASSSSHARRRVYDGLRAAYAIDVPRLEREAGERMVRKFYEWLRALENGRDSLVTQRADLAERFLAEAP